MSNQKGTEIPIGQIVREGLLNCRDMETNKDENI